MNLARARFAPASLLLACLAPPLLAEEAQTGFYLRGAAGIAQVEDDDIELDDRTPALQLGGGYRWGVFSLEAGLLHAHGFGRTQDLRPVDGPRSEIDYDLDGWMLGGAARWPLSTRQRIGVRAGVMRWDAALHGELCFAMVPECRSFDRDLSGNDWYAGVGWWFDWSERLSVGLSYEQFRVGLYRGFVPGDDGPAFDLYADLEQLSATAEWRF